MHNPQPETHIQTPVALHRIPPSLATKVRTLVEIIPFATCGHGRRCEPDGTRTEVAVIDLGNRNFSPPLEWADALSELHTLAQEMLGYDAKAFERVDISLKDGVKITYPNLSSAKEFADKLGAHRQDLWQEIVKRSCADRVAGSPQTGRGDLN